jgi:hypothetical protein
VLITTQDNEEIIERVAALDIGKAEQPQHARRRRAARRDALRPGGPGPRPPQGRFGLVHRGTSASRRNQPSETHDGNDSASMRKPSRQCSSNPSSG